MTISTGSSSGKEDYKLYRFHSNLFLKEKPNSARLIEYFTRAINRGYDKPRYKYNIIQTSRIKNQQVFVEDLQIYKPDSQLLMLVYTGEGAPSRSEISELQDMEITDADDSFSFDGIGDECVLGTIGLKAYKDEKGDAGLEITGFSSLVTGAGGILLSKAEQITRDMGRPYILAIVICEHELVPYYARYGYEEVGERVLIEIDEKGKVVGESALENDIYATSNFHLGFMRKDLGPATSA